MIFTLTLRRWPGLYCRCECALWHRQHLLVVSGLLGLEWRFAGELQLVSFSWYHISPAHMQPTMPAVHKPCLICCIFTEGRVNANHVEHAPADDGILDKRLSSLAALLLALLHASRRSGSELQCSLLCCRSHQLQGRCCMHEWCIATTVPAWVPFYLQGLGAPACARLLTSWYPDRLRGTFWGFWTASNNVGGFAAPILAGTAARHYGWRYASAFCHVQHCKLHVLLYC